MAKEIPDDFGGASFEEQFGDADRLRELRLEALLRGARQHLKATRLNDAVSGEQHRLKRRFVISGGPNMVVPVAHDRIKFIPTPRQEPIEGVRYLRYSIPHLPAPAGSERRLDTRFAFLDFAVQGERNMFRALLSGQSFSEYRTGRDIVIADDESGPVYEVDQDITGEINIGSMAVGTIVETGSTRPRPAIVSGGITGLSALNTILETYEPGIQDNLPIYQSGSR